MGYIEKNLMPGERLVYQTKVHWIWTELLELGLEFRYMKWDFTEGGTKDLY